MLAYPANLHHHSRVSTSRQRNALMLLAESNSVGRLLINILIVALILLVILLVVIISAS